MRVIFVLPILLILSAGEALGFPEMTRLGYFSCSTCHASAAGGDVLTPYGRSIASERLSTWAPGEGDAAGLGDLPDWLLLGGDWRALAIDREAAAGGQAKALRMQTELAAALVLPHLTIAGSGGEVGQGAPGEGTAAWRTYYVQVEAYGLSSRVGRYLPRFGLNIPQHAVNVRRQLGFGEGEENLAWEASWLSEHDELTLTRMVGALEQSGSHEAGWAASWFHETRGQRLGLSALTSEGEDGARRLVYGASGVLTLPRPLFALVEADRQELYAAGGGVTAQAFFFARLGAEPWQGTVAFLSSEVSCRDLSDPHARTEFYGWGLQWFPLPHLDVEGEIGPTLDMQRYEFVTTAYFMAHFYL